MWNLKEVWMLKSVKALVALQDSVVFLQHCVLYKFTYLLTHLHD